LTKKIIYIATGVCVLAILLLVFIQPQKQEIDRRVRLDKDNDKPYDLSVTYNSLPLFFDHATVKVNRQSPKDWFDTDSSADGKTIFFLITQHFSPNESELRYLLSFVKQGNQVFISTPYLNRVAKDYFGIDEYYDEFSRDSGKAFIKSPPFSKDTAFENTGFDWRSYFTDVDSAHYYALGRNNDGDLNFIKINAGKGSFYLHSDPLLFANYFLLYRNNVNYLEKAASLMPQQQNKIIWDEYFIYKTSSDENPKPPSPFSVLFGISAFRWAFLIAGGLLLLYAILGIKLLQRLIPAWDKPKNDTLDFTKTIGRLYFNKGDNTNLAKKMATYLLEFIRNKYFISTTNLNDEFIKNLSSKAGYGEEATKEMVGHLVFIQGDNKISEELLGTIYQSFSKFYKHTS